MRILIDATAVLLRSAGIKNYVYHWIQHLRQEARNETVLAFPYLDRFGHLTHEGSVLSPAQTYARLALLYFVNIPGNPALDWMGKADVFHVSNQIRIPVRKTKVTATLHDLTCWMMPELHTAANVKADRAFAEHALKRADRLIAVSQNTKSDAVRILGIDPSRIDVIYSGVPEVFFGARPQPAERPYALFVGTIEPRKNIDTLLDAWRSTRLADDFDLVIAGPLGWSAGKTMARLRAGIAGVRYKGYVSEHELPALTAGAAAFVYPSLYEGFGFPVAQAMAAGVPVITSSTSCLPEVAGDAAILVDPKSQEEIAGAMKLVLTSPSLRERLSAAGVVRAQEYRWETCARKSLEFFRRVQ